jgi:hypothetical protein
MTRPCLFLLACAAAAGCGGGGLPTCDIKGEVTFEGTPVGGGDVLVVDEPDTQLASDYLTIDGTFHVKQAPAGKVRILVRTESVKSQIDPRIVKAYNAKGAAIALPDPKVKGNKYVAVPAKYGDRETTDLRFDFEPGRTHEVKLELKR